MADQQEGRTELSHLGKFALIDRLTDDFPLRHDSSFKGIGDDCAVLGTGSVKTLVTTQTMAEGVHFDMTYTPLRHLGYKAISVALSNIAAMNALPRQVLVSIAVSNRFSVEALDELYAGIRLCCDRYDVDLVGGNISSSRSGMVITVTAIGEADEKQIAYRSGAHLHDLVCVSGDLGSAYSGLLILEREKVTFQADPNFKPNLEGFDYVLERYLKPEPRIDIVQLLRVDLDGDGTDEVLIAAQNEVSEDERFSFAPDRPLLTPMMSPTGVPLRKAGQYSVVLLRRVVEEQAKNIVLAEFISKKNAPKDADPFTDSAWVHKIVAIADLNGDGVMEVITAEAFLRGHWHRVYETKGAPPRTVLESQTAGEPF